MAQSATVLALQQRILQRTHGGVDAHDVAALLSSALELKFDYKVKKKETTRSVIDSYLYRYRYTHIYVHICMYVFIYIYIIYTYVFENFLIYSSREQQPSLLIHAHQGVAGPDEASNFWFRA